MKRIGNVSLIAHLLSASTMTRFIKEVLRSGWKLLEWKVLSKSMRDLTPNLNDNA